MSPLSDVDIAERLTRLETQQQVTSEKIDKSNQELKDLIIEMRQDMKKQENLYTNQLKTEVKDLEQRIVSLEEKVNDMGVKLAYYQGAIALIAFLWPLLWPVIQQALGW